MTSLQILDLSGNLLTSVPVSMTALTNLGNLHLGENTIGPEVPPFVSALTLLTELDMSGCGLTGSVPTQLSTLSILAYVPGCWCGRGVVTVCTGYSTVVFPRYLCCPQGVGRF